MSAGISNIQDSGINLHFSELSKYFANIKRSSNPAVNAHLLTEECGKLSATLQSKGLMNAPIRQKIAQLEAEAQLLTKNPGEQILIIAKLEEKLKELRGLLAPLRPIRI